MAYTINRYNGAVQATVQDGTINQSTEVKFIGKNYAGYGEAQNENFMFLLEHFAGSTAPSKPVAGMIWYDNSTQKIKVYNGTSWTAILESPADTGAGKGWSITQGADGANITGFTQNSMTQFKLNTDNQGAATSSTALSYSSGYPGSGQFSYHTVHQVPAWWPMYHAINVTSSSKGKVLNQINWQTHSNAVGNVDFFGSNNAITSLNFTAEANWTHLGRAHFGGSGGGSSDGTIYTRTFNSNNYGYQWYMIKGVDNQSTPVTYPGVGSQGGWAMYRLQLNKI